MVFSLILMGYIFALTCVITEIENYNLVKDKKSHHFNCCGCCGRDKLAEKIKSRLLWTKNNFGYS